MPTPIRRTRRGVSNQGLPLAYSADLCYNPPDYQSLEESPWFRCCLR